MNCLNTATFSCQGCCCQIWRNAHIDPHQIPVSSHTASPIMHHRQQNWKIYFTWSICEEASDSLSLLICSEMLLRQITQKKQKNIQTCRWYKIVCSIINNILNCSYKNYVKWIYMISDMCFANEKSCYCFCRHFQNKPWCITATLWKFQTKLELISCIYHIMNYAIHMVWYLLPDDLNKHFKVWRMY